MISLEEVIPTQNSVRNPAKINELLKSPLTIVHKRNPISLWLIDGDYRELYLHDGHTRVCALYLSGIRELPSEHFVISRFTTEQLDEINFRTGWLTPFVPRFECRLPDLSEFKRDVCTLQELQVSSRFYIRSLPKTYKETRKVFSIEQLVRNVTREL